MSRFVGFGDKSWDNLKNFFQTQGFEFLFLSQSARRVAFGGSMAAASRIVVYQGHRRRIAGTLAR